MHPDDLVISSADVNEGANHYCVIGWQRFSAHHPALPGHFPGRPVIPGVVVLQHVHELLRQHWPHHGLRSLPAVKFLRPVLPGELLLLGIEPGTVTAQGIQGRFICRCGTQTVAHGSFFAHVAEAAHEP